MANDKHQCKMWTNDEEIKYYNLAAARWELKRTNLNYDIDDHMPERMHDWDQRCLSLTTIGLIPYHTSSRTKFPRLRIST